MDAAAFVSAGMQYAANLGQQFVMGLFGKGGRPLSEPTPVGVSQRIPTPGVAQPPMRSTLFDVSFGAKSDYRFYTSMTSNQELRPDGGILDKGSGKTFYQLAPEHQWHVMQSDPSLF